MEEYGIKDFLQLTVTRCGRWMENREFIWSGLTAIESLKTPQKIYTVLCFVVFNVTYFVFRLLIFSRSLQFLKKT